MQLLRMFSTEKYKGTRGYLNSQRKYEVIRTALYFAISLSLFIAGYIATKTRMNLLTIVAVLGCLPASKSAVDMIMFLRFRGCDETTASRLEAHSQGLSCLFDMVFTSYQKNYNVAHMVIKGNTICGYTQDPAFPEADFYKHLDGILKADGFKGVSVKIFTDPAKYCSRLEQIKALEIEAKLLEDTKGMIATLKSVSL